MSITPKWLKKILLIIIHKITDNLHQILNKFVYRLVRGYSIKSDCIGFIGIVLLVLGNVQTQKTAKYLKDDRTKSYSG